MATSNASNNSSNDGGVNNESNTPSPGGGGKSPFSGNSPKFIADFVGKLGTMMGTDDRSPPCRPMSGMPVYTRPNYLPPKDPKEEALHRKMYEKIRRDLEKKEEEQAQEAAKREVERRSREKMLETAATSWESIVIAWENRNVDQVRKLVWQGIPPSLRGQVWSVAIGNSLALTPELFTIYKDQALAAKENFKATGEITPASTHCEQISLDLARTYPQLAFFTIDPFNSNLRSVLESYALYRPDIGYVQGMSFIAALLLLNLESFDAFVCFANMLNCHHFIDFFRVNVPKINKHIFVVDALLLEHIPSLHAHLCNIQVSTRMFVMEWWMTLYSKSLDLDIASHVWDCFLVDGPVFLFRTAIGILKLLSPSLEKMDMEECLLTLGKLYEHPEIKDKPLFASIRGVKLTQKRVDELFERAAANEGNGGGFDC